MVTSEFITNGSEPIEAQRGASIAKPGFLNSKIRTVRRNRSWYPFLAAPSSSDRFRFLEAFWGATRLPGTRTEHVRQFKQTLIDLGAHHRLSERQIVPTTS